MLNAFRGSMVSTIESWLEKTTILVTILNLSQKASLLTPFMRSQVANKPLAQELSRLSQVEVASPNGFYEDVQGLMQPASNRLPTTPPQANVLGVRVSALNTPDGMSMVWMGRLQGFSGMGRVYGPARSCDFANSRSPADLDIFSTGDSLGTGEAERPTQSQSALPSLEGCRDLFSTFSIVDGIQGGRTTLPGGKTETGHVLGGIKHSQTGKVYVAVLTDPKCNDDYWRRVGVRLSCRAPSSGTSLDAKERAGTAVSPRLRASAALEALSEKQSIVCCSRRALRRQSGFENLLRPSRILTLAGACLESAPRAR